MLNDNYAFPPNTEKLSVELIARAGMDKLMHYISPACEQVLGWKPEEMVGRGPDTFVHPEDRPLIDQAAARNFLPGVINSDVVVRMRRKDGSYAWIEMNASLARDPFSNEPTHFVIFMRDISAQKELEDRLSPFTLTDQVTGLANRRSFDESFKAAWQRTLHYGSCLSLIVFDIDLFRDFNDHYGRDAGDDLLRMLASTIQHSMQSQHTVLARYAGAQFALLLPNMDAQDSLRLAEGIRDNLYALHIPHQTNPKGKGLVSVTVGVSTVLSQNGGTMGMPENLLDATDRALDQARHTAANHVGTALIFAPVYRMAGMPPVI